MDLYDKLIENPLFFKWIFYPSIELESYWSAYLEHNKGDSVKILEFKEQFEKHLKYRNEKLSETGKRELAYRILNQMDVIDYKRKSIWTKNALIKYAAVAVLFFTIGSSLVYVYMKGSQEKVVADNELMPSNIQEPMLIIDGKKHIQLNQGQSELDYSSKKELVINQEKTVPRETERKIPELNTLMIPYGSRSVITLSDSSRVWVNAGSRLIYPSEFIDLVREVFLVGEAYFEVQSDKAHTFTVKTTDVEISVTGTHFNVSAYPEDYSVQTVLAEGSVKIKRLNAVGFEKEVKLIPGQLAYFNKKSNETNVINVDVDHYVLWTKGLFSFTNTDFNRIVKKLERYYNISFSFDDPMKGSIQITGKLDFTRGKDEVFEYLGKITGLEFLKINDNLYAIK
jgi:transmembrane sensor